MTVRLQAVGFAAGAAIFIGFLAIFWVAPGHIVSGEEVSTCNRLLGQPTAFNSEGRFPTSAEAAHPRLSVNSLTQIAACDWPDRECACSTRLTYQLHALPARIVVITLSLLCLISMAVALRTAVGPGDRPRVTTDRG